MADTVGSHRDDPPSQRTVLLRAAADNELSASQTHSLDLHLHAAPRDRDVIEFERRLRTEVAAAASSETTPDALRRSIAALVVGPSTASPRPQRSIRPLWALAAACVALAATVFVAASRFPARLPSGGEIVNSSHRAALTRFLGWQHAECEVHADAIRQRFDIGPAADAPEKLARIVQHTPDLGSIRSSNTQNVEYLGAARCAVPGRGESVHIVLGYRDPVAGKSRQLASLFVQEDFNELSLEPGRTYHMRPRSGEWDGRDMTVCVWRKDGLVYFLVGTSADALEAARHCVGAEPASGEI